MWFRQPGEKWIKQTNSDQMQMNKSIYMKQNVFNSTDWPERLLKKGT